MAKKWAGIALLLALVLTLTASSMDYHELIIVHSVEGSADHGYITLHIIGTYPYGCPRGEVQVSPDYHGNPIEISLWQHADWPYPTLPCTPGSDVYEADILLDRQFEDGVYRFDVNGVIERIAVP